MYSLVNSNPVPSPSSGDVKHILSSSDLSYGQICQLLFLAAQMKTQRINSPKPIQSHENRVLAMIFEKPSLRTRLTFEVAMKELGGHAIYLTKQDIDMGNRESVYDIAKNLSQWSAMIVARVNCHETICELAEHSEVPVVNALTDLEHPCQALADVLTIYERFGERDLKVTWIGDGNNVCNSFAAMAARLGHDVTICTPPGYEAASYVYQADNVEQVYSVNEAVRGANVIYTDVWVSMGQEAEEPERCARFAPYQVNEQVMKMTSQDAVFMHCLPAKRGYEVTNGVIEGKHSVVFEQAGNRLYAQKALMKLLLEGALS